MTILSTIRQRAWQRGVDLGDASPMVHSSMLQEVRCYEGKADSGTPHEIQAIATTPAVDMDDEVVVPSGLDWTYFMNFRSLYYNHDYAALPVATLRNLKKMPDEGGWRIRFSMARHPFARDVFSAMQDGAIRGTSIGFKPGDMGKPTEEETKRFGQHSRIIRTAKVLETSITPMPCNQTAIVSMDNPKSMIDDETARALEQLVVKGRIHRESAAMMGLPNRKSHPTCEPHTEWIIFD